MNLNLQAKNQNTFDAIVIGSGASGGWAAMELCEKGLKTLVLERGHQLKHIEGYKTATMAPWEFKHRGRLTVEQRESHPFLSRDYPYSEHNEDYWFDDMKSPYQEEQRFDWYRPDIVGGKSIMWGRQSYRWSDLDFEANAKEGIAIDWPIRYKDIAPWYDYVEKFVGISGQKEGLHQLPDGQFLPAMEMNCVEKKVKEGIESNFKGRVMTMGRVANLTQRVGNRGPCQYRNLCSRGCPYSGYFASQAATLPAAEATGNMTLRTDSIVNAIIYDEQQGKATGVRVIDANTNETTEYHAKIIFVNGSAIWSTWLLMNSTSDRFPDGLGNDSGVLGQYLMDHHFRTGAYGMMEGFEDKYFYGRRPNGIYVPRYRNVNGDKRDYLRGFGYQGGAGRGSWNRAAEEGIGASYKESLTFPGRWSMGLGGFGECLPDKANKMTLNREKLDKWGQPTVTFDCGFKENEEKMRKDMANDAAEMLEAAGCKNVGTYDNGSFPGMAIHEMGTARMGKNPKESVLNEWNQVHACKNVFVTDGACMTSASCVNPTLTYMALTARAADYAVKELKRMNL
ncbi:choline dehydrogenase-like flavoprotein [Anseongella ginsenosidimutans]|uniref:Choline dehydrogenase-like flavoprotein n=1 Tax=Anseongella ginsenosidimutans TaxID=496056 RepID=A0A4R3KS30_9SPHI|nr:GMC family oxidoreductase [Anseongella ginsenosidimutans]QEC53219.1 GMC family oxidoreductase [Anseongella ginsenosidimutans]TCS87854.1 choline dehydrogenase-like flavoprotein [Anseongella ginsenosidimutans]